MLEKRSISAWRSWKQLGTRLPVCSPLQVPALGLHMGSPAMQASQKDFNNAVSQVKFLKEDPGNEVKLKLYALYKQVSAAGVREKHLEHRGPQIDTLSVALRRQPECIAAFPLKSVCVRVYWIRFQSTVKANSHSLGSLWSKRGSKIQPPKQQGTASRQSGLETVGI